MTRLAGDEPRVKEAFDKLLTQALTYSRALPYYFAMLVNQNVLSLHGRTSIRLEPSFWAALDDICRVEGKTRHEIVRRVEADKDGAPLTEAVRVFVLGWFRAKVPS